MILVKAKEGTHYSASRASCLTRHGRRPELGLQSECPQAKMHGSFLTSYPSIQIEILHALLAVSMPNIILVIIL